MEILDIEEKKVNRILCLSELEFRLLMDVYSIDDLSGFKTNLSFETEDEKEMALNKAVFSLYKKGYLSISEGDEQFLVTKELAMVFSVISKCNICVMPECSNQMVGSICIYIEDAEKIVIMEPGKKETEYAKLRRVDREDILEYFLEAGVLEEQYIDADVAKMLEVTTEDMIGGRVKTEFKVQDRHTNKYLGSVSVVEYPLFDRILVQKDGKTEHYPMDNRAVVDKVFEITDLQKEKGTLG